MSPSAKRCRHRQSLDPLLHRTEMGVALNRMTSCLVVLFTYVLRDDGVTVAVVVSVVQHNGSHVDVGQRMTTSKNSRVIDVYRWSFKSRGRAENQPFTKECATNYQPITNEWLIGSCGCARRTVARRKVDGQQLLHLQLTRVTCRSVVQTATECPGRESNLR